MLILEIAVAVAVGFGLGRVSAKKLEADVSSLLARVEAALKKLEAKL